MFQKIHYRLSNQFHIPQHTFPNHQNRPTLSLKQVSLLCIAVPVPFKFGAPKFETGFRSPASVGTVVSVPKTAVHKNHGPILWKNDIGFPWEIISV